MYSTLSMLLRDYQQLNNQKVYKALDNARAVLNVIPTGGGKTVCFSDIMSRHSEPAAIIAHRREIMRQISEALATFSVKHRIVAPAKTVRYIRRKHLKRFGKSFIDQNADVGVASVQTLTSRASLNDEQLQKWIKRISLAVFDEGHHYVTSGIWSKAVDMFNDAKLIFMTATPERADGKGLGSMADGYADVIVEGPNTAWLINQGYLCNYRYPAPKTNLDYRDIPLTVNGDLNTKVMRSRIVESNLVGSALQHYLEHANGKQTIIFANDIATAEEIELEFKAAGINAIQLNGDTDDGIREDALEDFEQKKIQVVINVDLFDEGLDIPGVEAVILARRTQSLAKFLQMVGRALRTKYADGYDLSTREGRLAAIAASDKPQAIIIDMVSNWDIHGALHWPRSWSLHGHDKESRGGSDLIPQRTCKECSQPYEKFYSECPYCGEPKPIPDSSPGLSAIDKVDGNLYDLDFSSMDALFEKLRKENMSKDDYARSLFERGIPTIGHAKMKRKHAAVISRRKILKELVSWWVGAQHGRKMQEIHSRFYYRFGIDIYSAFTLDVESTDKLIKLISKRFGHDI